jgi:hemoglobin
LYEQVGGFDTILKLCRKWHALCLTDPLSAHPFEHPMHPQHDERLAAYLAEAFGGPALYTGGYGDETSVQRMHACNGQHDELDDMCLGFFDQALADVGILGDPAARASAYFRRATKEMDRFSSQDAVIADGLAFNYE